MPLETLSIMLSIGDIDPVIDCKPSLLFEEFPITIGGSQTQLISIQNFAPYW